MFWKKKDPYEVLAGIKEFKVNGIIFKLKKLNPLDHVSGAKVMLALHEKYKIKKEEQEVNDSDIKKMKKHYIDVFMASVIEPKLSRKENDDGKIWVENIFCDWDLANNLYETINFHTYGKKKILKSFSQSKVS